jgi:hypothetical protein
MEPFAGAGKLKPVDGEGLVNVGGQLLPSCRVETMDRPSKRWHGVKAQQSRSNSHTKPQRTPLRSTQKGTSSDCPRAVGTGMFRVRVIFTVGRRKEGTRGAMKNKPCPLKSMIQIMTLIAARAAWEYRTKSVARAKRRKRVLWIARHP